MNPDIEWLETDVGTVRYNSSTRTYRAVHDWGRGESLSTTLIVVIETVANAHPSELPPLYESINPDALDHLFESTDAADRHATGRLTLQYAGFLVTVHADGEIVFRPLPNN